MLTTRCIDRVAGVLEECGHSAGTARALAANLVRSWAATGKNASGDSLRMSVRETATTVLTAYERARDEKLTEAVARALARVERTGSLPTPDEQQRIAARMTDHATLAEGMMTSIDSGPLALKTAEKFFGRSCTVGEARQLLREELGICSFLNEALGFGKLPIRATSGKRGSFHGMHGTEKAVKNRSMSKGAGAVKCSHCGALKPSAHARCPSCLKESVQLEERVVVDPPNLGGVATPTGRKAKAKAKGRGGKPVAGDTGFEQLHPRKRSGAAGGGRFIQKGEGTQEPHGSTRVLLLQQRLKQLGNEVNTDGQFGDQTEAAVKAFQTKYGLEPTGQVDERTLLTLRNPPPLSAAQVSAQEKKDAGGTSGKSGASSGPSSTSKGGSSRGKSNVNANDPNAVKQFQRQHGLPVNGKWGAAEKAVQNALNLGSGSGSSSRSSKDKSSTTSNLIRRGDGMSGKADPKVTKIQQQLEELGYDLGDGGVDGRFGGDTEAAIRKFQRRSGLRVDGVIGPQTLRALGRTKRRQEKQAENQGFLSADQQPTTDSPQPKSPRARRQKVQHARMEEASYVGTQVPWGGIVPFMRPTFATAVTDEEEPPQLDFDMDGPTREPPNFRESGSDEWPMCGNCLFFSPQAGPRCRYYNYPAMADDLCDTHSTLTQRELQRYVHVVQEAEAKLGLGGSTAAIARANLDFGLKKLEEFGINFEERLHPRKRKGAHGGGEFIEKIGGLKKGHSVTVSGPDGDVKVSRGRGEYEGRHFTVSGGKTEHNVHSPSSQPRGAAYHALKSAGRHDEAEALRKPGGAIWEDHSDEHPEDARKISKLKKGQDHQVAPGVKVHNDHQHGYSVTSSGRVVSRHGDDAAAAAAEAHKTAKRRAAKAATPSRERHALYAAKEDDVETTLSEVKSSAYPGLDRSPKENWVDKAGGLPKYIERIAKHLHYEKGKPIGQAIAIAVNVVKKMCSTGDVNFPGKQNVNPKSRAEACAAVAQWEKKKVQHALIRETVYAIEAKPVPKDTLSLVFAMRTLREIADIDEALNALSEGTLSAEQRKKLPKSAFAIPPDRYPIHDEAHARNALARAAHHGSAEDQAKVRAAVKRRYPHIGNKD